jgi:hypothetical protein
MATAQPAAGLAGALTGSPAAPLFFAAVVMVATVADLAAFRRLAPDPTCRS